LVSTFLCFQLLTELLTNILGIFEHFGIALKEKKPANG
jgi:hypothetical protein